MRRSSWIEALVAAAMLVYAPAAHAQDDDPVARGIELRQEGRDAEAADVFRGAWESTREARALAQLALAEQALGRWVDARGHLVEAMSVGGDWIERHEDTLRGALSTIGEHVGRLDVGVDVEGATIRVNNRVADTMPAWVQVGSAVIQVEAPGHVSVQRSVEIETQQLARIHIPLVPRRTETVSDPVDVDPPEQVQQPEEVPAEPDPAEPDPVPPPPPAEDQSGLWAAGIGLAAGALLTAVATGIAIGFKEDAAQTWNGFDTCAHDMRVTCPWAEETYESALGASIGLGIGTALMAGAAVMILAIAGSGSDDDTVSVGPGTLRVRW